MRARAERMGDLHEQIYQLGVTKWDLEAEVRNATRTQGITLSLSIPLH